MQPHVDYQVLIFKDGYELFSNVDHTHTGLTSTSYNFESSGKYVILVLIEGIVFEPVPVEIAGFELELGNLSQQSYKMKMTKDTQNIPDLVRNNAKWWSEDKISDSDFAQGLQFMIKQDIIKIPPTEQGEETE